MSRGRVGGNASGEGCVPAANPLARNSLSHSRTSVTGGAVTARTEQVRAAPRRSPVLSAGRSVGAQMRRDRDSANLDLLRAIALIAVVSVHVLGFLSVIPPGSPLLRMGRFAVLLFFVHTSLVLTQSLARRYRGERWSDLLGHFLVRRCFRIYPLSILLVLTVFTFKIPAADIGVWSIHYVDLGVRGLLANLLLVQNLTYTPSIAGQLWSLPLEMQMYVLLPFLFLLAHRTTSVRPLLGLWLAFVRLGALPLAGRWAAFLVLLVSLPVLLYHTLEAPLIRYGTRLADRWFPQRADGATLSSPTDRTIAWPA